MSSSNPAEYPAIAPRVIDWQYQYGRHDLPWQGTQDPYRVWLSEIMLQQTQVASVIRYYARFLARFPTVAALAHAPLDEVLAAWAGLGYYTRGRHLHQAARIIVEKWGGEFPSRAEEWMTLPGVGASTAAAITALAYGHQEAILDGNVKRVLSRHAGWMRTADWERRLWSRARGELPVTDIIAYTQGLMDLGATICTPRRPVCRRCPLQSDCVALARGDPGAFPGRALAKSRPARAWQFLAVIVAGAVLLERRPASGIWPALWCLPRWDWSSPPTAADPRLRHRYHVERFAHEFTHFRLDATVHVVEFDEALQDCGPNQRWFAWTDLSEVGLPAPISRLLQGWHEGVRSDLA